MTGNQSSSTGFSIAPVRSRDDILAATRLFRAYAASLPVDLGYQDFEAELAALLGKYAPPHGALLLARGGTGDALGCVGVRPIEPNRCAEMKRLYTLPEARGLGLGSALATAAVEAARRLGYIELRLDTLPIMQTAIAMYTRMGFRRIEPYYAPVPEGTIFLSLDLRAACISG